MSMNCGTCTCNQHKMPGFLSACQFNSPWASTYIWCLANYGHQQTLPSIIKKKKKRFAQDIYIYSIIYLFNLHGGGKKNTCTHSLVHKNQEIFLDSLNDFREVFTGNLQHSVSWNMKYSLLASTCWLSNYIHMSSNDSEPNDHGMGYTPIWNIA